MFRRKNPQSVPEGTPAPERKLFDERTYLDTYPDIAAAGVDPFVHFMETGWREQRRPSALFDADWYARHFPEGQLSGINPLSHYLGVGGPQGVSPTVLFDSAAFCAFMGRESGPDFIPLAEFLDLAPDAAFNPCPLFDTAWFIQTYPELGELEENYLLFFAREGARNGYNPSPHFDCAWYLEQYPDVAASHWNPLAHYLSIGQFEGRMPLPGLPDQSAEESVSEGAFEVYGEYSAYHTGEADVIRDEARASARWSGKLALHIHIFYDDLVEQLYVYAENIKLPFSLFISVPDEDLAKRTRRYFSRLSAVQEIFVEVVPNRGRDLAPMLTTFAGALEGFDLLIHLHTKKSLHSDEKRDWLTQMLHHLLASENHVDQLLGMFADEPDLGLVFPVYHPSVRDQVGWGSNLLKTNDLLQRMGLPVVLGACPPFPAGSCFVVHPSILKPLWQLGLGYGDFDDEDGSVDGSLAHVVERALGILPRQQGLHVRQVKAAEPHALSRSWMRGRSYQSSMLKQIISGERSAIPATEMKEARDLKIVVYSCATEGYDSPLPFERAIAGAEYRFFSDTGDGPCGIWRVAPLQIEAADPVRTARLHKMLPHLLFPDADIAIWIDANVAVTGDISVYLCKLLAANAAFGLVRHPIRRSFVEEARALSRLGIERADTLSTQIGEYLLDDVPDDLGLTETNFMLMDLRKPETISTLDFWREEVARKSSRDQVSFDYARWKSGAGCVWLFEDGGSVRSNSRFAYFEHGAEGHAQKSALSGHSYAAEPTDSYNDVTAGEASRRSFNRTVDVIVPVHDAFEDVRACLDALGAHRDALTRLILVDDGSDEMTAELLRSHAERHPGDLLIRHDAALGYTCAANAGLRASSADVVVLLNSDTVVTTGAIRKLVAAIERNTDTGLAGPLSNAASWQSVPEQMGPDGDYVTNQLPEGWSLLDVAAACERIGGDPEIVVPALNGFCLAISRRVIGSIGYLDETAFPQGYGEETDYCFRAADAGLSSVIVTDSYVFHSKSRSFGHQTRRLLSESGYRRLIERYGSDRLARTLWALGNTARLQRARKAFRDLVVRA